MAGRSYPRVGIEEFGAHLLQSNDLDPVYVALHGMNLPGDHLRRWLLAYWLCYNVGTACLASEQKGNAFWSVMRDASENCVDTPCGGRWPRGHERRHWRGQKARECLDYLQKRYDLNPELMPEYCASGGDHTCRAVMDRVAEHKQFGPWIGFKVADMAERVMNIPIDFTAAEVFMFKDPKMAALMLWRTKFKLPETARPKDETKTLVGVVDWVINTFSHYKAPPRYDRPIGLQEAETILCCWKAHMNGFYPFFNDQDDINSDLEKWLPHSETARKFYRQMPKRPN